MPPEFYPTDMHFLPRSSGGGAGGGAGGKKSGAAGAGADTYLVTSADGKLQVDAIKQK